MLIKSWVKIKNLLYDGRYLKPVHSNAFVVSVGNITWGGTGKTSLIQRMGSYLLECGYRLAIVSRGYGRKSSGLRVVSDGKRILEDWENAGEEAYLLAKQLPGVMIVVAERRAIAFEYLEQWNPQVILLDDAFQHRRVARDLDLVVVDASEDLTQQRMIPFGKLREPIQSLSRADAIVLTHVQHSNRSTEQWIRKNIVTPVFRADYVSLQKWAGKNIAAFCAIGRPEHFFKMLEETGARVVLSQRFRDHHHYTEEEIRDLEAGARHAGADALVTTAKDAVKIPAGITQLPVIVAGVELQLENADAFFEFVRVRMLEHLASV
ncbi:MAG: tetraacyldisaccharide 4'-kinase [Acidobacteria bacterium]|nr:MAG: tetraacyldisaccharide 4'-kinase [Acidobacteriota bacterium]